MIDDGNAVYLVFNMKETTSETILLNCFDDIPHLMVPVVTDSRKAAAVLNWSVQEMEKRYSRFAENNVRNMETYNKKFPEDKMPAIVIIIDELADLMMVAPHDVEDAICRLAQKARAAGIHMVLATQRGEWKENPLVGVGVADMAGDEDLRYWKREITENLARVGIKIKGVSLNNGQLEIKH